MSCLQVKLTHIVLTPTCWCLLQMLRHQIMKLPSKDDTRKQLDSVQDEIKKIQQDIASHQHTYQVGTGLEAVSLVSGSWQPCMEAAGGLLSMLGAVQSEMSALARCHPMGHSAAAQQSCKQCRLPCKGTLEYQSEMITLLMLVCCRWSARRWLL